MAGTVFVYTPDEGAKATLIHGGVKYVRDLLSKYSINCDCYVISEGKIVNLDNILESGRSYTVCLRMRGGKGGFGSMLRAIGAQISKTTNREACRDLSGRRMRDVNNEKKMQEYIEKKAEQDREREQKKKEKLESLMRDPKHFFNDPDYENKLHESIENVDKAVEKGILEHSKKRKLKENGNQKEEPKLKKGLWLGEDDISSGDSDSDDEEDARLRITVSSNGHASSSAACCSTSENKTIEDEERPQVFSSTSSDSTNKDDEKSSTKKFSGGDSDAISDKDQKTSVNDNTSLTNKKSEDNESHPVRTAVINIDEIDLSNYNTVEELEQLGLEPLKQFLMKLGVKCGGSLKERASRLLLVKNVPLDQIDPNLLAPKSKKRRREKK